MFVGADVPTTIYHRRMRAVAIALAGCLLACQALAADEIRVAVRRVGEAVVMDVEADVTAPVAEAWAVLIDYDHMASFISNIRQSKATARSPTMLEVTQSGATKVGFWSFDFAVVRSVDLVPQREIRSALISGDFKSYLSTTFVSPTPTGTRITHHGEYVPNRWLPPIVGTAVIESETKKQYREFVAEIERRASAARTHRD